MKSRLIGAVVAPLVLSIALPANAALESRLGGLAYYDTATNLTWLANANAAVGSAYDTYNPGSGEMTWATAKAWAASLDIDGVANWRLPDTNPINGTAYNYSFGTNGAADVGFNMSAPGTVYAGNKGSEMAYLFYNTLGNTGGFDPSGTQTSCGAAGDCLTHTGPFTNIQSAYSSATVFAPAPDGQMWLFNMNVGGQGNGGQTSPAFAWAVHDGDVGLLTTVPVPASVYLFGTGLIGLMGIARRSKGFRV